MTPLLSSRLFPLEGLSSPTEKERHFDFTFNEGGKINRGTEEGLTAYGVNGISMPELSEVKSTDTETEIEIDQKTNQRKAWQRAIRQVPLSSIEEWTLYNDHSTSAHPFHLHVNHFQIISSSTGKLSCMSTNQITCTCTCSLYRMHELSSLIHSIQFIP